MKEYKISTNDTQHILLAAMASADITPDRDVYLEGYEERNEYSLSHCPEDFTSDLQARILLLDNGIQRLIFLNLELIFVDSTSQYACLSKRLLEKIAQVCHTDTDHILLSNTHTHHAPMQLGVAQEENILQAVKRAWNRRVPAVIRVAEGQTNYGVSRSNDYKIDKKRPYDNVMTVLRIDEEDTQRPIGMLYSVPIHNTLYGHGPNLRKNRHLLNCEFTGYACRALEQEYKCQNPDFVAMHHNGFCGNAGPIYEDRYYALSLPHLQMAGANLAKEIGGIYELAGTEVDGGAISVLRDHAVLPVKKGDGFKEFFGDFSQMPLNIHTASWADIAYLGVNFEPFSIMGAYLRAYAPYQVLLCAANVDGWRGYIPTRQTYRSNEICEEAEVQDRKTPLSQEAEEAFVQACLDTLLEMAGVRMETTIAHMHAKEKEIYEYVLEESVELDKLVISFGQELRTHCAANFRICLCDEEKVPVEELRISNFSSSYLGLWLKHAKIRYVRLFVENWQDEETRKIPEIIGLKFHAEEK